MLVFPHMSSLFWLSCVLPDPPELIFTEEVSIVPSVAMCSTVMAGEIYVFIVVSIFRFDIQLFHVYLLAVDNVETLRGFLYASAAEVIDDLFSFGSQSIFNEGRGAALEDHRQCA